jgi:hypothetical protein
MDKKKAVSGIAGVAVIGILSYLGYRVFKELEELDIDFFGENIEESYHQRYPTKNGNE